MNTGEGQTLIYELYLTHSVSGPASLGGLGVFDGDSHRLLLRLSGAGLSARVASLSNSVVVVYLEIDLPRGEHPRRLEHRVDVVGADGASRESVTGVTAVDTRAPVELGAPLEGGPWVAVHSPEWARGHRRVVYVSPKGPRIPGRYAVDWVAVDGQGRITHGGGDVPAEALGYGARVLAGIDGLVAATHDGMAEADSIRNNPRHSPGEGAGNYVALTVGDGRYVFYEHLRPGSITVKPGERVRRGQVIGALGFSGDTTGPHLHLHVADSIDTLEGDGLPFVIRSYQELGRYQDVAQLGHAPWAGAGSVARRRSREWPAYNAVVRFDGSAAGVQVR